MSRCWLSLVLIGGWGSAAAGGSASVVLHCGPTLTAQKRMEWHIFSLNCKPSLILVSIHIFSSNIQIVPTLLKKCMSCKKSCWTPSFLLVFFSRTVGASWRLAKKNNGNVPRWDLRVIWYKSWAPKNPGPTNGQTVLFDGSEIQRFPPKRMWGVS